MTIKRASRLCVLLLAAAWCGMALGAESHSTTLERLAFMTGHWMGTHGDVVMEELWMEPRGGVMLGLHRDAAADGDAFFEYLRIEARNGRVVYIASPKGRGQTEFPLARVGERSAAFENPNHDFPQRIIYERDGDRLAARVEGVVDGELRSEQWVWQIKESR